MRKRRTKAELDPSILTKIVAIVKVGASRAVAAAQAGVSDETLRSYERLGKAAWAKREAALEAGEAVKLSASEAMFAGFYEDLRRAEAHTQAYALGLIQKAGRGDWRAAAWLLEKLYPGRFGERLDVKHSGKIEGDAVDLSKLTTEELWHLRQIRKKLTEGDKDDDR